MKQERSVENFVNEKLHLKHRFPLSKKDIQKKNLAYTNYYCQNAENERTK